MILYSPIKTYLSVLINESFTKFNIEQVEEDSKSLKTLIYLRQQTKRNKKK